MNERHGPLEPDAPFPLSDSGARRRDAMLQELLEEVPRAAARRTLRRAGARTAGALALVAIGAVVLWPAPGRQAPPPGGGSGAGVGGGRLAGSDGLAAASSRVERVATDPGVVARMRADEHDPVGARIERIDDDDLLRTLSAMGRPVGLVRDSGRVALTGDVTDAPGSAG